MGLSCSGQRRTLQPVIALVFLLTLSLIAGNGCGGDEDTDTTASVTTGVETMTATVDVPPFEEPEPETPEPSPEPEPVPAVPLAVVDQLASPYSNAPGATVTFTVEVQGEAASVTVRVAKKMDDRVAPFDVALTGGTTSGDITTWTGTTTAPALQGLYAFNTTATAGDGTTAEYDIGVGPYGGPNIYFEVI